MFLLMAVSFMGLSERQCEAEAIVCLPEVVRKARSMARYSISIDLGGLRVDVSGAACAYMLPVR